MNVSSINISQQVMDKRGAKKGECERGRRWTRLEDGLRAEIKKGRKMFFRIDFFSLPHFFPCSWILETGFLLLIPVVLKRYLSLSSPRKRERVPISKRLINFPLSSFLVSFVLGKFCLVYVFFLPNLHFTSHSLPSFVPGDLACSIAGYDCGRK